MPDCCARFVVSGRVQGVWFRASTVKVALGLGLVGYAENQADGTVLVLAQGSAEALDQLQQWLRRGPPLARVDALQREDLAPGEFNSFVQR